MGYKWDIPSFKTIEITGLKAKNGISHTIPIIIYIGVIGISSGKIFKNYTNSRL